MTPNLTPKWVILTPKNDTKWPKFDPKTTWNMTKGHGSFHSYLGMFSVYIPLQRSTLVKYNGNGIAHFSFSGIWAHFDRFWVDFDSFLSHFCHIFGWFLVDFWSKTIENDEKSYCKVSPDLYSNNLTHIPIDVSEYPKTAHFRHFPGFRNLTYLILTPNIHGQIWNKEKWPKPRWFTPQENETDGYILALSRNRPSFAKNTQKRDK